MTSYPKARVARAPVIVPGMTCPHCNNPVRSNYVYSLDGHPYRCFNCLRVLIKDIKDLRSRNEAEDNKPARQPTDIQ